MMDGKNNLDAAEMQAVRKRRLDATPGPWKSLIEGRDHTSGSSFVRTGGDETRGNDIELSGATMADQDFIAHAREDVPRLLEEVVRFRAYIEKLDEQNICFQGSFRKATNED